MLKREVGVGLILFRADANDIVAIGHVMRCLSVADELRSVVSQEVAFCMSKGSNEAIVRERGYRVFILDGLWNDLEREVEQLIKLIDECAVSLLIIDSYYVSTNYFEILSSKVKTVYIDDRNKEKYACDYIVNYSFYASHMQYEKWYRKEQLLLGAFYAPLRKQFSGQKRHVFSEPLKNILILSGGTDQYNFSKRLAEKLAVCNRNYYLTVITGGLNKYLNDLKELATQYTNVKVLCDVKDMAVYMNKADIAVSACGSTIYELCACGTPIIGYGWVDNHMTNVEKYEQDGLMIFAGDLRNGIEQCIDKCLENIEKLVNDKKRYTYMSAQGQKYVDGNGAANLAERLSMMI